LVAVLSWLDDPNIPGLMPFLVCSILALLLMFCLFLHYFCPSLVILDKTGILWIFGTLANVEGQRQVVKDISTGKGVVLSQVIEEGFFVAEEEVVGEMIVDGGLVIAGHHFQLLRTVLEFECIISFFVLLVFAPVFFVYFGLRIIHQFVVTLLACRVHLPI